MAVVSSSANLVPLYAESLTTRVAAAKAPNFVPDLEARCLAAHFHHDTSILVANRDIFGCRRLSSAIPKEHL